MGMSNISKHQNFKMSYFEIENCESLYGKREV